MLIMYAGINRDDFSVSFGLDAPETEDFVGREPEIGQIHNILQGDGSRRTAVVHGLGGIGKTQLAVAYAKRHRDNYSGIFWINIQDEPSLRQSFVRIAQKISRQHSFSSSDNFENSDKAVAEVKDWLSRPRNTRWLLIYDNYDRPMLRNSTDPEAVDIRRYLPDAHQGSVLITTRSAHIGFGQCMQMKKLLDLREGLEILIKTSRRGDLINGRHFRVRMLKLYSLQLDPDSMKLAERLDGLPLALATAGAYLNQTTISCADYLRLYESSWLRLLKSSPDVDSYDRMLYSTWQLTVENVEKKDELAAQLLKFWAYFSNDDVWFELLHRIDDSGPRWLQEMAGDEIRFNQAIRVLGEYGLVEPAAQEKNQLESGGYSMHSCVHSWTIHVLNPDWDPDLAFEAMKCISGQILDTNAPVWWVRQRRILHHAAIYTDIAGTGVFVTPLSGHHALEFGSLFYWQDRRDVAERLYQRALNIFETNYGSDADATVLALRKLGQVYQDRGELNKAEKAFYKAFEAGERMFGPEHASTTPTLDHLGAVYHAQGRLDEAEKMYGLSLRRREEILGPDDLSLLESFFNIGGVYCDQGKLYAAEWMFLRALTAQERILGPDNVRVLNTVNNLANVYSQMGRCKEAEALNLRALQGREEAFGPFHTSTLDTVDNLGVMYMRQRKIDKAKAMFERELDGYIRLGDLAETAPRLALARANYNLACIYANSEDPVTARELYIKAQAFAREAQGESKWCQEIAESIVSMDARIGEFAGHEAVDATNRMYGSVLTARLAPSEGQTLAQALVEALEEDLRKEKKEKEENERAKQEKERIKQEKIERERQEQDSVD